MRSLRLSGFILILLVHATSARADAGIVQLHQAAGPFMVTVFTEPTPLRSGEVDVSVMVQDLEENLPQLDAQVFVTLRGADGVTLNQQASHAAAKNKLLYSTSFKLPHAGEWELDTVIVMGSERATLARRLTVFAARPTLASYWRLLGLPPILVLLFAANQWLKNSSRQSSAF